MHLKYLFVAAMAMMVSVAAFVHIAPKGYQV